MKNWRMIGLSMMTALALALALCCPALEHVTAEAYVTQMADERAAIEEQWAALPEGVREALDEDMKEQLPLRWMLDPFFGDRLSLLLQSGDQVTACLFEQSGGEWKLMAKNDSLVSLDEVREDVPVAYATDGGISAYLYTETPFKSQDFFFEHGADGALSLTMFRDMGNTIDDTIYRLDAREGGYLLSERLAGDKRGTTVYALPGLGFEEVNGAALLALIRDSLSNRNEIPQTPPRLSEDALPEPSAIEAFSAAQAQEVFAAPDKSARALGGEALSDGWLQVFGVENGWALVQHNVEDGVNRIGYVPAKAVPSENAAELSWMPQARVATIGLTLTDDPLRSGHAVLSIAAGESVKRLASFGDYWAYVEVIDDMGKAARGFVIDAFLVPEENAPAEVDELTALVDYWIAQYGKTRYLDVDSKERFRKAHMSDWPPYDAKHYNAALPMVLRRSAEVMLEDDRVVGVTVEILARHYVPDTYKDMSFKEPAYQIMLDCYDTNFGDKYISCWIAIDAETGEVLGVVPGGNG